MQATAALTETVVEPGVSYQLLTYGGPGSSDINRQLNACFNGNTCCRGTCIFTGEKQAVPDII
jgi:hypothetical protein